MTRARRRLLLGLGGLAGLTLAGAAAWITLPRFLEQPAYRVTLREGAFELRAYPGLVVAEVVRTGPRDDALRAGFPPLARYIFAREREGERISMTAPVTQGAGADGGWRVQFVMPRRWSLDTLPAPANPQVRLRELPPGLRAAVRFSGVATDARLAEREAALRAWMGRQGLAPVGTPVHAYYNDPSTPGVFRRNEVLIDAAGG